MRKIALKSNFFLIHWNSSTHCLKAASTAIVPKGVIAENAHMCSIAATSQSSFNWIHYAIEASRSYCIVETVVPFLQRSLTFQSIHPNIAHSVNYYQNAFYFRFLSFFSFHFYFYFKIFYFLFFIKKNVFMLFLFQSNYKLKKIKIKFRLFFNPFYYTSKARNKKFI